MVREEASGKRFLNLYGYTGTFTFYAAAGCASETTTTTALPLTIAGATRETSPSNGGSAGERMATTPVGSGTVKLK